MTTAHPTTTVTSGNPALSGERATGYLAPVSDAPTMSTFGVALKTALMLAVLVAGASWGWASATEPVGTDLGGGYGATTVTIPGGYWLAMFGAFAVGMFVSFNPRLAGPLGLVYSALQGYCMGALSASFEAQTEGIVGAAILATGGVFLSALFLYLTGIIRPTQRMAFGVAAAMGGLFILYLFIGVLSLFNWGWLYSDSFRPIGLAVTVLAIILAALSLTLDFARIEAGVRAGAPKQMEWYCAWGLMVTLIWLYIELLRLLALLSRDR